MIKKIFHFYNFIIISLYIYPGSLFGLLVNSDISKGPKIFPSFIFALDHFCAFLFLSLLGLISYFKNRKKIIMYLILISVFLEFFHLLIPNREFQISDIFANITGIFIPIFIFILFKIKKKKY